MKIKILLAAILAATSMQVSAATINSGNTQVDINTATGGADNWIVDGTDPLYEQRFYYRIGSTGPEMSLGSLGVTSQGGYGAFYETKYAGTGFNVVMQYTASGGQAGSGVSNLGINIAINNTGNAALDFHLFQYNDFDLSGPGNDTVQMTNANTILQTNGANVLQETVATPRPDAWELGIYPATLESLIDDSATILLNNNGPISGDVTWTWEWNSSVAAGRSANISKSLRVDLAPVPVPAAVWLLGSGLIGLIGIARRKV